MSQAALNVRNRETKFHSGSGCSNGARLAGMVFLLMVIGVMVAGGLVVLKWMNDTARLPLSRLVLTGKTHYTTSNDVRRAILSLGTPGTFMSQDVDIIQQQIERLPWIQQVSVRKQWPDELKIHLVEYVPVARWNDLHMVDAQGQSFSVPAKYSDREVLPMLYGPEGSEQEVLEGYHQMRAVLDASRMKLKAAVMTDRRSWQLTLADDTRIDLGREKVMQRLTRFIELYPALQQQGQSQNQNRRIIRMDLRYDSGAAVEWAPALVELQDSKQQQDQTQAQAKQQ